MTANFISPAHSIGISPEWSPHKLNYIYCDKRIIKILKATFCGECIEEFLESEQEIMFKKDQK